MLGEISRDDRLLMPFSCQAAAFSILQQEISFSSGKRLGYYIRGYDINVPISANKEGSKRRKQTGSSIRYNLSGYINVFE